MKKAGNIFITDIKKVSTNWVAALLIGGLIILPSLYAWFNIAASWNPYERTESIKIGVVNEDTGSKVRGRDIDAGKEVVDELKKNHDLGWQFNGKKEGMKKVRNGDFYATIIIPKDFSKHLATVLSDHPKKAQVEYYVNEKKNAIAPKITSKGASTIVNQISSKFVDQVNGAIFKMFNDIGIDLEKERPDIKRFEKLVFTLEKKLPGIKKLLDQSLNDANQAQGIVNDAQNTLPKAKRVTKNGIQIIDDTDSSLSTAVSTLNAIAPRVKDDLLSLKGIADTAHALIQQIKNTDIDPKRDLNDRDLIKKLQQHIDKGIDKVNHIQDLLTEIDKMSDEAKIQDYIDHLEGVKKNLKDEQTLAKKMRTLIDNGEKPTKDMMDQMNQLTSHVSGNVDQVINEYDENIKPFVLSEIAKAKQTLQGAKAVLTGVQGEIPKITNLLNSADDDLKKGKKELKNVQEDYPFLNRKVKDLADRIRKLEKETNLNEIIDLLKNKPGEESAFLANPVELNENKLFPLPNYGAGMNPFYSTLAIWVGGLLLVSLLATDIAASEGYTATHLYFGRLFTFLTFNLLQTLIVTLGDIYLLGVYIISPFWFVIFGMLASIIFITIIYTLVSLFGNVGKAMAIVLLVLQIAGSGGTYPVQLLPQFFKNINPFLPFTYAIDLMREAAAGIVWANVSHDVLYLVIFGVIAVLMGTFLKKPLNDKMKALMEKSRESGLFH